MPYYESSQFNKEKIMGNEISEVVAQDSKNIAILTWIGSIFFVSGNFPHVDKLSSLI